MARDLRQRTIIITGASSGIGAATAIACAEAGMNTVLGARREDRLHRVAEQVRSAGQRAIIVPGDVTDPEHSRTLLESAEEELGRVDAVFANAGYGLSRRVIDLSEEELRQIFDVNFFASVDLIRQAAHHLIERSRPGHLLMCSSCVSKFSMPLYSAYAATKAAQNAVCSSMRLEHRTHGIDVTSVHPITTTTEFFKVSRRRSGLRPSGGKRPAHASRLFTQPPERVARAIVRCLRRPCPEVWTSHIVRIIAGAVTISPRFGDWVMDRQSRTEMAESYPRSRMS